MLNLKKILLGVLIASAIIAVPLALNNGGKDTASDKVGGMMTPFSDKVGG
jgi:hypothetical protein